MKNWIKNFEELTTTEERKIAFNIINSGLDAIDTAQVIAGGVKLENNILEIQGERFDLNNFKRIKVVGFGKASCEAALALEKVLGDKIKEGAVIGLDKVTCEYIETFAGTHPLPSSINIPAGEKIYEIVNASNEEDLIIALVSGGGSALLCCSETECTQNIGLYNEFLKSGQTINEINTIRKHLSILKGGGLAKIAYPATLIGLIFSDIPGDNFGDVASGPTYKDETTMDDALKIIAEHNLGRFDLIETPKENKYFEKVHNFVLVSNTTAVLAMQEKSRELGFEVSVVSTTLYSEVDEALNKIFSIDHSGTVVLAAGEPKLEVTEQGGSGGRNLFMALRAVQKNLVGENEVFIALASDGMDNSDAAGAVVDTNTIEKIKKLNFDVDDYIKRFDAYPIFEKSGDMIMTGPTGANVSDLMLVLKKK